MDQDKRDRIIFWFLLSMKMLTAVRTGIDTYAVSGDLLNVILLDGVFLGLWLLLAYGGKGKLSLALRPFAALFSFLMYSIMVVIGWEAHLDNILIAFAVRLAGFMLLTYDTWDYIVALRAKREENKKTLAEEQSILRRKEWAKAYRSVLKQVKSDFRLQAGTHLKTDMLTDGEFWTTLPALHEQQRALPSGKFVPDDRERPRTTANRTVANLDMWSQIYPELPTRFTRKDVEAICDCEKTAAVGLINIGKREGDIEEVARGTYRKVSEGLVVDNPPKVESLPEGTSTEQLPVVTVHTPGLISTEPTPIAVTSPEDLPLTPEGDVDKFYVIREKLDGTGWEAVCAICTQGVYYGQNRREVSDSIEEHVRSQHTSPADFS